HVAAQRHHVVPQPGVLEHRHLVGLLPERQDLLVADPGLAFLPAAAQTRGRPRARHHHDRVPPVRTLSGPIAGHRYHIALLMSRHRILSTLFASQYAGGWKSGRDVGLTSGVGDVHEEAAGHGHGVAADADRRWLSAALALIVVYMAGEVFVGLIAHSL